MQIARVNVSEIAENVKCGKCEVDIALPSIFAESHIVKPWGAGTRASAVGIAGVTHIGEPERCVGGLEERAGPKKV